MKTYLFVCLANINRSVTAASVLKGLLREVDYHDEYENREEIAVQSAGVSPLARQPVTRKLAKRADLIFVMEEYMKDDIVQRFDVHPGKIIVLGIPDIYEQDDPVLVSRLRKMLRPYVQG